MTFSSYINEGLSYLVNNKTFEEILRNNSYKKIGKNGSINLYSLDNEYIFSYDYKKERLVVNKRTYQLMNIKRGY